MNDSSVMDKAEWRRRLRAALKDIPPAQREADSARARELLRRQTAWQEARTILFYAPLAGELDLTELLEDALQAGKTVALPRFIKATGTYQPVKVSHFTRDCAPGQFGIAEPGDHCLEIPLKRLDLVLAPGLGFDLSGRRLGRGQGFYDRLLAGVSGVKCGVAFEQQIAGPIPAERHDVTMNFILTPTRWVEISKPVSIEP